MFYRKKKPVYATKQPNAKQVELSGLHNCGVALTGPKAPDTPFVSVEAGFFNQLQYIENTKRYLPKKKLVYSTKPGKIDNDDNDIVDVVVVNLKGKGTYLCFLLQHFFFTLRFLHSSHFFFFFN